MSIEPLELEKQEKKDREILAKKAHVPVEEIKPTAEEEFNGKVNKLVKDIFVAVDMQSYDNVQLIKRVINDALAAAHKVNYETAALAGYDPFALPAQG